MGDDDAINPWAFWPPWKVDWRSHLPVRSRYPDDVLVFGFWKGQIGNCNGYRSYPWRSVKKRTPDKIICFGKILKQYSQKLGLETKEQQTRQNEIITSSQPPQHQRQRKKKTPVSTVWAIYMFRWKETILCVHFRSLSYMKTLKKIIYPSAHPSTQLRGVPTKEP